MDGEPIENGNGPKSGVVVFFGNLPWATTAEEVKDSVKAETGVEIDAQLSTRKDGRSRGYATARVSEDDAATLIDMSMKFSIGERNVKIERRKRRRRSSRKKKEDAEEDTTENGARKRTGRKRRTRKKRGNAAGGGEAAGGGQQKKDGMLLFFGNVPWDATAENIEEVIKEAVGIDTEVKVSERGDGRSRGYATARVPTPEANQLMDLSNELSISERKIRIEQKKRRPRRRRQRGGGAKAPVTATSDAEEDTVDE